MHICKRLLIEVLRQIGKVIQMIYTSIFHAAGYMHVILGSSNTGMA